MSATGTPAASPSPSEERTSPEIAMLNGMDTPRVARLPVDSVGSEDSVIAAASGPAAVWQLLLGASLVVISALAYRAVMGSSGVGTDDTHIHLRIARNWASGFGPVFNVGERVEASSSPAWLALIALGFRLGFAPLTTLTALELAAAAWVGATTAWIAHRLGGRVAGWLAPLALGALPSFGVWMVSGMETSMAAAALTTACAVALSARKAFDGLLVGLLCALLVFVRQEALAVVPFIIGVAVANQKTSERIRFASAAIGACLLLIVAGLLIRHAYFGAWVPNTYVAKVSGATLADRALGIAYIAKFAGIHVGLLLLAAWLLVRLERASLSVALVIGAYLAAVAWTGGDHFFYHRLAVPTLPLLASVAATAVVRAPGKWRFLAASALASQIPWALLGNRQMNYAKVAQEQVHYAEAIGGALAQLPAGTVATIAIGGIGYASNRPILDLVGLADKTIARSPRIPGAKSGHNHADTEYVLARQPELVIPIVWLNEEPTDDEKERSTLINMHASLAAAEQLVFDPRLRERYAPIDLVVQARHVRIWERRDLIGAGLPGAR